MPVTAIDWRIIMKADKLAIIVALTSLGLAGCAPAGSTESSSSQPPVSTSQSPSGSTASSEEVSSSEAASSTSSMVATTSDAIPSSSSSEVDDSKIDELLEALHASPVAAVGNFQIDFYEPGTSVLIKEVKAKNAVAIGDDYYYNKTEDENGSSQESEYYRTKDGYVATRELLPTNEVRETIQVDENKKPYAYDSFFYNFLAFIDKGECHMGEDGLTIEADGLSETDKAEISYGLTFYEDIPLKSLSFSFDENGNIHGKLIGGATNVISEGVTFDMQCTMEFEIVTPAEAGFVPIVPFDKKEGDDELDALFDKLQAGNYTVDIERTGGLDDGGDPQRWYLTDNAIVRINLDSDGKEAKSGNGYYDTGEGIDHITYEFGVLSGSKTLDTTISMDDIRPPFLFAAAAFDLIDGKYVLKTGYGFEQYVEATLPDAAASWDNQYYRSIDEGSLAIAMNDDGTATFSYSYSYLDYGNTVSGTVKATVSAIGETSLPFAYQPYEPPDYSAWSGYDNPIVEEFLERYIGDGMKYLPVLDPSAAKSKKVSEVDNYSGNYLSITLTYADAESAQAVYDEYKATLVDNGWQLDPLYAESRGLWQHAGAEGGYYHINFNITSKNLYFRVYQPTIALNDWFHGYFDESIGSWFNYTTTVKTYDYDEATGERGEKETSSKTTKIIDKMDDGIVKRSVGGLDSAVYYEDSANNQFIVIEKGEDNKWYQTEAYDLSATNLENYGDRPYVLPSDLFDIVARLEPGELDGEYVASDEDAAALAKLLFGIDFTDTMKLTILLNYYDNVIDITFADETISDGVLTETTYLLEINHAGYPTTLSLPSYTVPEASE